MLLLKRVSFYLAAAGIAGTVMLVLQLRKVPAAPPPVAEPAHWPYSNSVAASGIVEASRENVKIGAPKGGLIQKIFVQVGSRMKAGEPVLQLDARETRAQLASTEAQLEAMRASLSSEKVLLADAEDQFRRVENLERQNVASVDERTRKEFALQNMQARVAKIEADIKAAAAQVELARTNLEILTIRAPRDGTVLQVNVREGEYAGTTPTDPLMILGETDKLQIRADVDEQNAPLVSAHQPAVAFFKEDTQNPFPLRFTRYTPH